MAELKTKASAASVADFLGAVDPDRAADTAAIDAMLRRATGAEPKMWGPAIVGYGEAPLVYPDGRTVDWFLAGFSPRKANFTLYLRGGFEPLAPLLARLGKHDTGKGCLYVKRLADVDPAVLEATIAQSVEAVRSSS